MATLLIQSLLPTAAAVAQLAMKDPDALQPVSYPRGHRTTTVRQNNLVQGNPGHWNSYSQSAPPKKAKTKAPNVSHYVKPIHVPLPLSESQIWQMKTAQAPARADARTSNSGTSTPPTMLSYGIDYTYVASAPAQGSRTKTGKSSAASTTRHVYPAPQI